MNEDKKERLAENVRALPRRISFWVMAAAGTVGAAWASMSPETQGAIIAALPIPIGWAPVVASLLGIASQIVPRRRPSPDEAPPALVLPVTEKDRSE